MSENEGFCVLQAILQQQFILSSDLWALFVATNLLCLIVLGRSEEQIRGYERFYHPIAWGLPMVTWLLLLIGRQKLLLLQSFFFNPL